MKSKGAVGFLFFLWTASAFGHGDAQWINEGRFMGPGGALCCGENDCKELKDGDVVAKEGGYFIKSLNELVPYDEAQPSPDGKYWRCAWPKWEDRRCFFAPPPGS